MNCLPIVDGQREYFPSEQRQTRLTSHLNSLVDENRRNRRQSNSHSHQLSNINQARRMPSNSNREAMGPSNVRIL